MGDAKDSRPVIAMPVGDPTGIGPEIALRTALDAAVLAQAKPVLISDEIVIENTAGRLGLTKEFSRAIASGRIGFFPVKALNGEVEPGTINADAGAAAVAYAQAGIHMAQGGDAFAVVAAPHNETAIAKAGISFSGYPQLLAETTATDPQKVFLMLITPRFRIVHATLHVGIKQALDNLTAETVRNAVHATNVALKRIGIEHPHIGVCGINPHAGENGLFGNEDEFITAPSIAAGRAEGIDVDGPFGADLLFSENAHDAYIAIYHDQGHIPAKIDGRNNVLGISIGTPVLFSTVAHGSAHNIAGLGKADPTAFTRAVKKMATLLAETNAALSR